MMDCPSCSCMAWVWTIVPLMMLDKAFDGNDSIRRIYLGSARFCPYAGIARACLRAAGNGGLAANGH